MTGAEWVAIIAAVFSGLATLMGIWATTQVKGVKAQADAVESAMLSTRASAADASRAAERAADYVLEARGLIERT